MMTKYVTLTPLENLKGFATSRPPIIVFIVCLGLVAIILMTLGFYIKDGELKTADITEDWNVFLESFSDVEFCIQNGSFPASIPALSTPVTTAPLQASTASIPATDALRNYSISMMLAIQPTPEFVSIPHNLTMVSGYISASELGLRGVGANERISVAAQLPFNWNTSQCGTSSSLLKNCALVHIYTCVTFQASEHVFPLSRSPAVCEIMNSTGVEYHAQMRGHHNPRSYSTRLCRAKPVIHINYKLDPTLTVLLTLSDRSLINLHLLHTSYFLFVMTITVLLYAMVRGRPMKLKLTSAMSLPLTANTDV